SGSWLGSRRGWGSGRGGGWWLRARLDQGQSKSSSAKSDEADHKFAARGEMVKVLHGANNPQADSCVAPRDAEYRVAGVRICLSSLCWRRCVSSVSQSSHGTRTNGASLIDLMDSIAEATSAVRGLSNACQRRVKHGLKQAATLTDQY